MGSYTCEHINQLYKNSALLISVPCFYFSNALCQFCKQKFHVRDTQSFMRRVTRPGSNSWNTSLIKSAIGELGFSFKTVIFNLVTDYLVLSIFKCDSVCIPIKYYFIKYFFNLLIFYLFSHKSLQSSFIFYLPTFLYEVKSFLFEKIAFKTIHTYIFRST